ncbi:MAG: hypothetical protein WCK02_05650 [Bacteroidota bacterium]
MKKNIFYVCITLILVFSCKKEKEYKSSFNGSWHSDDDFYGATLQIKENHHVTLVLGSEARTDKHTGRARITENRLKINAFIYFEIIEAPHLIDTNIEKHIYFDGKKPNLANWKMVLNGAHGLNHKGIDRTFYKREY